MRKNDKIIPAIIIILIILLIISTGLFVYELYENGWKFSSGASRGIIVIIGILLSLSRYIMSIKPKRPLSFYESLHKEHIEHAFSGENQSKERKTLIKATAYYSEDKLYSSLKLLKSLLKKCQRNYDYTAVIFFKALCLADLKEYNEAISAYKELLAYDSFNSTAWSNLGIIYKTIGNTQEALQCYQNAVKYDTKNAVAWNNIAQYYVAECSWENVIEPAQKALELNSNMYQAHTALTVSYFALGDVEKSKAHYEKAIMNGANKDRIDSVLLSLSRSYND